MIEFRAEVSPERRPVAGTPPRRQSKAHHVKHAQNRSHADKDSENQTDPDEELHNTYQISKEDSMGEYDVAENGPIEADRRLLNVAFKGSVRIRYGRTRFRRSYIRRKGQRRFRYRFGRRSVL